MRSLALAIFLGCALVAGVIYESGAPERHALAKEIAQEERRLANAKANAAENRWKVEALEKQEAEWAMKEKECQRIEDIRWGTGEGKGTERDVDEVDRIFWRHNCDLQPSGQPDAAGSEHD